MPPSLRLALIACGLLVAAPAVFAQSFPNKPIRFLVPFAPGGVGDLTARITAQKMSEHLGQQIIIDNRPSAGMIVSAEMALKADADGYTMLLTGNGTAVSASLFKSLPYDALKDFAPVGTMASFDMLLVTNTGSSLKSVGDVLAYARANPGKMNLGHINIGSTQSLAAALFKSMAAIDVVTVPYKGTPALLNALRAGDVDVAVEFIAPLSPLLKNNQAQALAVLTDRRSAAAPGVPSMADTGALPGFRASSWNAVSVRAGTPRPIVERLNRAMVESLAATDVKQRMLDIGVEARSSTPEEMGALMAAEIIKWRDVIDRANIPRQ